MTGRMPTAALFNWIKDFTAKSYDLIGLTEMYPSYEYRWGKEAVTEKAENL